MVRDADQRSRLAALGWRSVSVMTSTLERGRWLDQLERALGKERGDGPGHRGRG